MKSYKKAVVLGFAVGLLAVFLVPISAQAVVLNVVNHSFETNDLAGGDGSGHTTEGWSHFTESGVPVWGGPTWEEYQKDGLYMATIAQGTGFVQDIYGPTLSQGDTVDVSFWVSDGNGTDPTLIWGVVAKDGGPTNLPEDQVDLTPGVITSTVTEADFTEITQSFTVPDFSSLVDGDPPNLMIWFYRTDTNGGNLNMDLVTMDYQAIPEPSTLTLLLLGLACTAGVLIRRRRG